jgi:hypothetical protein
MSYRRVSNDCRSIAMLRPSLTSRLRTTGHYRRVVFLRLLVGNGNKASSVITDKQIEADTALEKHEESARPGIEFAIWRLISKGARRQVRLLLPESSRQLSDAIA